MVKLIGLLHIFKFNIDFSTVYRFSRKAFDNDYRVFIEAKSRYFEAKMDTSIFFIFTKDFID